MHFVETPLRGAWVVELDRHVDDRGFFARAFCADEFQEHGINPTVAQTNMSHSPLAGTLRGLHYQLPPAEEAKFLRCVSGRLWDVMVDLRPTSATYRQWFGVELSAANGKAVYVPEGFAHGYLTLQDDSTALYTVSVPYTPGTERGLRYDDPALGIAWPREPVVLSDKDRSWAKLDEG